MGPESIFFRGKPLVRDAKPGKTLELIVVETKAEARKLRKQGIPAVTERWLDVSGIIPKEKEL